MTLVKSYLSFFVFALCIFTNATQANDSCGRASVLYGPSDEPSRALLRLLATYELPNDGSWESIVESTQEFWLQNREPQSSGFQIPEPTPAKTFDLFSNLGMLDPVYAECTDYRYAIVLAGHLPVLRQRFEFLKKEWDRGIRFHHLVILAGDRKLDSRFENEEHFLNAPSRQGWQYEGRVPSNESEMVQFVYDQMDLPDAWRQMKVTFVGAPTIGGQKPNTIDTFVHWLRFSPKAGSALIVSSQPFVGRHDTIARQVLPCTFGIDTIGRGINVNEDYDSLDGKFLKEELARWIYQERSGHVHHMEAQAEVSGTIDGCV